MRRRRFVLKHGEIPILEMAENIEVMGILKYLSFIKSEIGF